MSREEPLRAALFLGLLSFVIYFGFLAVGAPVMFWHETGSWPEVMSGRFFLVMLLVSLHPGVMLVLLALILPKLDFGRDPESMKISKSFIFAVSILVWFFGGFAFLFSLLL